MSNLIIIGAGVDKSAGINLPLANELIPQLNKYYTEDQTGIEIDKVLRSMLPRLRFSYDLFVNKAIDKLASEFKSEVNFIVKEIDREITSNKSLTDEEKKLGEVLNILLNKIRKIQEEVEIDSETEELIKQVFSDIIITDDFIIDLPKLSFTDTFNIIMKRIFQRSIQEPSHPILKHIYKNLMDLESLLLKHFIGFYSNSESEIKNYLYISWTLWAFLKHKEQEIIKNNINLPFYSNIPADFKIVTFNYTSFSKLTTNEALYFHGNLTKYIRIDTRNQVEIDGFDSIDFVSFFNDIIKPNIDFDKKLYVIPSIIPPLKLKPVLSNEYIDIWYNSKKVIEDATKIIVIGYSFNYADEHFNDIIRRNKHKNIIIIDPFIKNIIKNIERIFSHRESDYVIGKIQNKTSYTKDNLKLIEATALEIDLKSL